MKKFLLFPLLFLPPFLILSPIIEASVVKKDDIRFGKLSSHLCVTTYIYQGDEDEIRLPVSATVYLLPGDIAGILKEKGFVPEDEMGRKIFDEAAYLDAIAVTIAGEDDENARLSFLIHDVAHECKFVKFTTGKEGNGRAVVPNGSYYLFAVAQIESELFIWHQPLDLLSPTQIVELDQYNAEAVAEK